MKVETSADESEPEIVHSCNLASLFASAHIDLQVPSLLKSQALLGHALTFSTQVLLHHVTQRTEVHNSVVTFGRPKAGTSEAITADINTGAPNRFW
jgi:hypothetical protein